MNILQSIRSFVSTVDAGSIAGGAKLLGISAAAVSQNIARLEQHLGVRLLHRTTRSLALTERDIYLRTPIFELLAQHQRAAMVLAADEAVAARLVSGPGVELKPSLPNRPLLLALLLVAAPLACLFGGACVVLLRGGRP